jgi:hypothetical protein
MKISINYRMSGDTVRTVTTTPKVMVEWERHMKTKATRAEIGIEDLSFMVWECLRSTGTVVPTFDVWLNNLEELDVADGGADQTVPTGAAPSAD